MKILTVSIYSSDNYQVKYGYNQLMNHLGIPFRQIEDFENLENSSHNILVIPESSIIKNKENWNSALNRVCAAIIVGDTVSAFRECKFSQKNKLPPNISGFFSFEKHKHIPFFFEFPFVEAEKGDKVFGEILSQAGQVSNGIIWHQTGEAIQILIAPQIFRTISYFLCSGGLSLGKGSNENSTGDLQNSRLTQIPCVNMLENIFMLILLEIARKKNIPFVHKWYYPSSKEIAVCLTHDVDSLYKYSTVFSKIAIHQMKTGQYVEGARSLIFSVSSLLFKRIFFSSLPIFLQNALSTGSTARLDFSDAILSMIDLESKYHAPSSFFFLNNSSRKDSNYSLDDQMLEKLVKLIEKAGCEIGLHGSYYSYAGKMLNEEKERLEKTVGHKITGIRQHYLRLWIPQTWRLQSMSGLTYDTSIGDNFTPGFSMGCCLPFFANDENKETILPLVEIPLVIEDIALSQDGKTLDPDETLRLCEQITKTVSDVNGVITMDWHADYFDEQTSPGWTESYRRLLDYYSKLNVWFANGQQLCNWWISRTKISFVDVDHSSSTLKLKICSDGAIDNFTFRVFLPKNMVIRRVKANGARICRDRITRRGESVLLTLNLIPKTNEIEIET